MASGVLMLIFSFLAFYKVEESDFFDGQTWSAWSNALNLFPLATVIVLIGVALAAAVAAARFGGVSLPAGLFGFSWSDLRLLAGILGTLTLLAYLLRSTQGVDKGIGLIITTLASVGLLVGAVMERQASSPAAAPAETGGGAGQPTPAVLVILGSGLVLLIGSFLSVVEDTSAWGEAAFPLFTLPAILGVIVAGQVAAGEFAGIQLPGILGLTWSKIRLSFSAWAAFIMVALLIGRVSVEGSEISKGAGFWIMLVASIALVVGAVMKEGEGARPAPAAAPPPPPPPA